MPMLELLYRASSVHRMFFDPTEVQQCTLLSIKTGGCTEDCGYCSQSVRHKTFVKPTPQMKVPPVPAPIPRSGVLLLVGTLSSRRKICLYVGVCHVVDRSAAFCRLRVICQRKLPNADLHGNAFSRSFVCDTRLTK